MQIRPGFFVAPASWRRFFCYVKEVQKLPAGRRRYEKFSVVF